MPDDRITDGKTLSSEISAFGERLAERRRFERKTLLWAATIDVRGQRVAGTIIDLSAGGARLRFDAAIAEGEELTLALNQLTELGAKVIWRREGEAGIQFLLAPDEVAARVQDKLALAPVADEPAARAPDAPPRRARKAPPPGGAQPPRGAARKGAAIGIAALALLAGGVMVMAMPSEHEAPRPLVVTAGAIDQHSCASLMNRVNGATNSIDFDLSVASAVNSKCLNLNSLGSPEQDLHHGMVQATKRSAR